MKKAIITGATGAIGMALIDELLKGGVETLLILHKGSKRNENLPHHKLLRKIYCSLDELSALQNEAGEKFDVFFHLAWAGAGKGERNNLRLQLENVHSCLDAVELANRFHCHTFLGAGSQAEYGRVEGELFANTPAFPENGYGICKLCAGNLSKLLCKSYNMRFIWTRILSVYGPYDGENSMIISAARKLLAGERAPFTLGEQEWDYLYSADAAEALCLIAERGIDQKTYVLGSGDARPLKEYIRILERACGAEGRACLGALPYAEKQVMYLKANIEELEEDTGWAPKTKFEDGIKMTIDWLNKSCKPRGGGLIE